jgi:hypothetical protein
VQDPMMWMMFINELILPAALGPGIRSASSRNEYKKHPSPVREADNLTAICESIV